MVTDESRSVVLAVLHRLFMPVTVTDLVTCANVMKQADLDTDTVNGLIAEDRVAFFEGIERAAWICPALEYPDGWENNAFVTRSDWPLRARLVHGGLSVAQELSLLKHLCDIALIAAEKGEAEGGAYRALVGRIDDLTVRLPQGRIDDMRGRRQVLTDDLIIYRELAEDLHGELVKEERAAQAQAVEALERLGSPQRYFGIGTVTE